MQKVAVIEGSSAVPSIFTPLSAQTTDAPLSNRVLHISLPIPRAPKGWDDKDDDDKKPSNREDVKESGFVDPASSH